MVCKILSPWSDERAGTPKSVAQIAVAHFSILQSPHPRWLWHRHVRHCARRHPPIEGAMTVKTKKIIMVELVETNVFSRWHCTVCDGCTNPVSVLAEGKDGKRAIRVCEQCLEAAEIDKRLAATAAAHERHAAYLRSLVGRLRVPTYAAWKARIEKVEASRPWRLEVHARN
jgi:hypothetical protein